MPFSMLAILAGLTILTVWGFISPRTQWHALTNVGRRNGDGIEPGGATVAIHRTVAGVALAAIVVVGFTGVHELAPAQKPVVHRAATDPVRQLWGDPDPVVVNRVFPNVSQKPASLTEMTVLAYQVVDGPQRNPDYLFELANYSRPKPSKNDGYIGSDPNKGFSALDTADLVVQVIGDSRCTPHQVSVLETASAVVVGVYYGRPDGETLVAADRAAPCNPSAVKSQSTSVLVPISLAAPLSGRPLYTTGGTVIAQEAASTPTPAGTPTP